jgi:hypothetical protein
MRKRMGLPKKVSQAPFFACADGRLAADKAFPVEKGLSEDASQAKETGVIG